MDHILTLERTFAGPLHSGTNFGQTPIFLERTSTRTLWPISHSLTGWHLPRYFAQLFWENFIVFLTTPWILFRLSFKSQTNWLGHFGTSIGNPYKRSVGKVSPFPKLLFHNESALLWIFPAYIELLDSNCGVFRSSELTGFQFCESFSTSVITTKGIPTK